MPPCMQTHMHITTHPHPPTHPHPQTHPHTHRRVYHTSNSSSSSKLLCSMTGSFSSSRMKLARASAERWPRYSFFTIWPLRKSFSVGYFEMRYWEAIATGKRTETEKSRHLIDRTRKQSLFFVPTVSLHNGEKASGEFAFISQDSEGLKKYFTQHCVKSTLTAFTAFWRSTLGP